MKHAERILSLFLALMLCLNMVSVSVLAEDIPVSTEETGESADSFDESEISAAGGETSLFSEEDAADVQASGGNETDTRAAGEGGDEYCFIIQPAGGSIEPEDKALNLSWKTNFIPEEVVIGYYMRYSGGSADTEEFYTALTLTEGLGAAMDCILPYDDAYSSTEWVIRARCPGSASCLESARFSIMKTARDFDTVPEETITVAPGSSTTLSWSTNFTSVKTEIMFTTQQGTSELIQSLSGYEAGAAASWVLPYSKAYPDGSYDIRAYYNSTQYISCTFWLSITSGIEVFPESLWLRPDDTILITWPQVSASKIEVWSTRSGKPEKEATLSGNDTSYEVQWKAYPESYTNYELYLKVFPSDGSSYYYSNVVVVENLDYVIELEEGHDFYLDPDESVTVHLRKSFTPSRIDVWSQDSDGTVSVLSASFPGDTAEFEIPYEWGDCLSIRAYYASGDFYASVTAYVHHTERAFTTLPYEDPTASAVVNWETNFDPSWVEVVRVESDGSQNLIETVVKTLPGTDTSALIPDNEASYAIRAWFEDYKGADYLQSQSFKVTGEARLGFTVQPQNGVHDENGFYTAEWGVNFEPDWIEIVAVYEDGEEIEGGESLFESETTGSGGEYSTSIQLTISNFPVCFRICVYYWEDDAPFVSDIFTVEKGQVCGQNLKWTLDDGVLAITGTGTMFDYDEVKKPAPWHEYLTEITSVEINEGAASIGNYAFCGCTALKSISIPAGIDLIGEQAFKNCLALTEIEFKGNAPLIGTDAFKNVAADAYYPEGMDSWTADVMKDYGGTVTWHMLRKCGDHLIWELDDQGVLTVSGEGDMWDFSGAEAGWYARRSEIRTVIILDQVTGIGSCAFSDCTNLERVQIGRGVTSIGSRVFQGCGSLDTVVFNGPAPGFDQNSFYGAAFSAYYIPDTGWTADVRQSYGGTVTWIGADGQCGDGAFWTIDDAHVLHITGSGPMYNWTGAENVPWAGFAGIIASVEIESGITTIGDYAFCACVSLASIILPDSLNTIGQGAFMSSGLMEIAIPANVTEIKARAFMGCSELQNAYYFDTEANWNAKVTVGSSNETLKAVLRFVRAMGTCGAEEDNLVWLLDYSGLLQIRGEGAMKDYTSSSDASSMEWYEYRSGIKEVRIQDGATSIGDYAFSGFTYLRKIVIPDTVTAIGSHALSNCMMLSEAVLPKGLKSLGTNAFSDTGLISVTIPGGLGEIPSYAFEYCMSLREVTVGYGITKINNFGFNGCYALTSVTLPESLKTLGSYVFSGCSSLKEIHLPDSLTKLATSDFANCTSLASILVPAGIKDIPYSTFGGCTALAEIYFPGSAPSFASTAFNKVTANAYYLMNDTSWTESVCQNYGGTITWNAGIRVDETNFPDENFRKCVSNDADIDGNDWLIQSEIDGTAEIRAENLDIRNTKGIELFTQLISILLNGAPGLKSIDLSANVKLTDVNLSNNGLTSLELDGLTELKHLSVEHNKLTWLDVSGLQLETLYCQNNPLVMLTLGTQNELSVLYCYGTGDGMELLDIRNSHVLLNVYQNGTKSVPDWGDLYELTDAGTLYVDAGTEVITPDCVPVNGVSFPDARFRRYVSINIDKNHSGWLTPEEIADVESLVLANEQIRNLDGIGYFTSLTSLEYCDGRLEALEAGRIPKLNSLNLGGQKYLTSLNLDGALALKYLYVNDSGLHTLDVSDCGELVVLACHDSAISDLTLGSRDNLKQLSCYGTNLTSLSLYECPILSDAYLNGIQSEEDDYAEYTGPLGGLLQVDASTEIITAEPEGLYLLWLGETQVSDANKDDILGDGSTSYDPVSGTLNIVKAPAITGLHRGAQIYVNGMDLVINASVDLTLNSTGKYAVYAADNSSLAIFGNITVRGGTCGLRAKSITIYGNVDIDAEESALLAFGGDIVIYGNVSARTTAAEAEGTADAIFAAKGITIEGNVTASATHIAVCAKSGSIRILDGVWTLEGGKCAMYSGSNKGGIIPNEYIIRTPEGGMLVQVDDPEGLFWTVTEPDGVTAAKKVVFGPDYEFEIVGANMTLGNELSMNFFVRKADIDPEEDYFIRITKTYADGRNDVVSDIPSADWTNYNSAFYSVKFNGVAAKEMNDLIYVQVFYADGTEATPVWEDSVVKYALRIFDNQNDKTKTVLVDMLNYGSAAQTYFKYDLSNLANSHLTDVQKAYASSGMAVEDHRIIGENYIGSNLNLGVNLQFSMFFQNITPEMYAVVTFTSHTGEEKTVRIDGEDFELFNASSGIYRIYIEEMVVADARQLISCTVYNTSGTAVASASDSIESYIARMASSSNELFETIMIFADSAYAFFHR